MTAVTPEEILALAEELKKLGTSVKQSTDLVDRLAGNSLEELTPAELIDRLAGPWRSVDKDGDPPVGSIVQWYGGANNSKEVQVTYVYQPEVFSGHKSMFGRVRWRIVATLDSIAELQAFKLLVQSKQQLTTWHSLNESSQPEPGTYACVLSGSLEVCGTVARVRKPAVEGEEYEALINGQWFAGHHWRKSYLPSTYLAPNSDAWEWRTAADERPKSGKRIVARFGDEYLEGVVQQAYTAHQRGTAELHIVFSFTGVEAVRVGSWRYAE